MTNIRVLEPPHLEGGLLVFGDVDSRKWGYSEYPEWYEAKAADEAGNEYRISGPSVTPTLTISITVIGIIRPPSSTHRTTTFRIT
jgi:hypothetical protein